MKNKLKKIIKFIAIIFTCLLAVGCIWFLTSDDKPTYADAGFSTSHSSGGSSHSSSSHSSSSSSHRSSSSSSSSRSSRSSSSGDHVVGIVVFIVFTTIFIIIIVAASAASKQYAQQFTVAPDPNRLRMYDEKAEKFIKQYLPNFDKMRFLNDQYNNYCRIQVDWMNFTMEDAKELISDELYTMWCSQLETLRLKGEQNIMGQFELESAYLTDASMQNGNLTVATDYVIKTYDYIANYNTKKLVRGNNKQRMRIHYDMRFRLSLDHMNKIDKCPSCGNQITNNTSNVCPYCRSQLFVEPKNWVLTEKTCIHQEYTK